MFRKTIAYRVLRKLHGRRMNSTEPVAEGANAEASAAQTPKLTGAQKDWLWIRRGALALTLVGAPIVFVRQIRAEVSFRQFLSDHGYENVIDWLRMNIKWLNIPVDVPDEYRQVERPNDGEGAAASMVRPAADLHLPRPSMVEIPVRSYSSVETRESLQRWISPHACAGTPGRGNRDRLEQIAWQQKAQADTAEFNRLLRYMDTFGKNALWRPTAAIERTGQAAIAAASAPPPRPGEGVSKAHSPATYTGSSSALAMDACEHLNDEYEHTSPRYFTRPARYQLVPSASTEQAIAMRLRAIQDKVAAT